MIEVLVVIAIIGILSVGSYLTYRGSMAKARDVRRKSDIKQYKLALENYANEHNSLYPNFKQIYGYDTPSFYSGGSVRYYLCPSLPSFYLTACPNDPLFNPSNPFTKDYYYSTSTDYSKWVLWNSPEKPTAAGNTWVSCSNAKTGELPLPYSTFVDRASPNGVCSL